MLPVNSQYKFLLIDTNILLLLLIGNFDKNAIGKFKRTRPFLIEDYNAIVHFCSGFQKIYTTSNILTEITNLSENFNKEKHNKFFKYLHQYILKISEWNTDTATVINGSEEIFYNLGLTDTSIFHHSNKDTLVLTVDLDLYNSLRKAKKAAMNYNHYR